LSGFKEKNRKSSNLEGTEMRFRSFAMLLVASNLLFSTETLSPRPQPWVSQQYGPSTDDDSGVAECLTVKSEFAMPVGVGQPLIRSDYSTEQEYESAIYDRAIYPILRQHARMEYMMYWKHMYGFVYYGDVPPEDNPLEATTNDLDAYLRSVALSEQPAGILVYWRSQHKGLCAGLILSGKRMLVQASPLISSTESWSPLKLSEHEDPRVARPRAALAGAGLSSGIALDASKLPSLSAALVPSRISEALAKGVVRSLLIVPIENLGVVPFAALTVSPANDPLIKFTTITVAPGFNIARRHALQSPRRTWKQALIVGDPKLTNAPNWIFPELPGARQEAIDVATLLGNSPLLGLSATHDAVVAALAKPATLDLVYFATHGISDPDNPQDHSFIALRGGSLYTRQVEKLKLKGRPLVVLSACQTGLGKQFEGGMFGMALNWYYAGADAVVTSLWNVDDSETHDLMLAFMRRVKQEVPPSRALAEAMVEQRAVRPDSLDWASFTIYGGLPH
jgi:hypothetical protein